MEEALAIKAEIERSLHAESSITIRTTLAEFLTEKRKQGLKLLSAQTVEYKLHHFLPLDLPVSAFSADKAQQLYEAETMKNYVDADTLRNSTVRRVSAALGREPTPTHPPKLIDQLRALPPQAVADLLRELSRAPA